MRLLVLGGTQFVGRAIAEAAVAHGLEVTTFNRGRSGADAAGVVPVIGDRYDDDSVRALARGRRWDAVIDTSGYVPANTLSVARALEQSVDRYVFVSSVSVYTDWPKLPLSETSPVLACPQDAGPDFGEDTEDGPTRYGYQKSGCETAVRVTVGESRTITLRPGVVLGPNETVGRLTWWLARIAAGGHVLGPGNPDRIIQPIDVRDLADFTLRAVADEMNGSFNLTGRTTLRRLLQACADVTGSGATFTWVPDEVLLEQSVRQWSEMPLWRTYEGVWQVDSSRALAAGLRYRSVEETVTDTWAWMRQGGRSLDEVRVSEIGIDRNKELAILAAYGRQRG